MNRFYLLFRSYGPRMLAIVLPIIVLGLVWTIFVVPLVGFCDGLQDRRDSLVTTIAAERREAAAAPAWANALLYLQRQEAHTAGTRIETSEALAQAGLQNDIQQMVQAVGGQVISVETMPAVLQSGYQMISIRASLALPSPQLAELLKLIEGHVPYMFISSVSFQVTDPAFDQNSDPSAEQINMLCTITSYRTP